MTTSAILILIDPITSIFDDSVQHFGLYAGNGVSNVGLNFIQNSPNFPRSK